MRVTIRLSSDVTVEAQADTLAELHEQIAKLTEIFGQSWCQVCNGRLLRHVCREVDGNKFHELHCCRPGCGARLAFGQHKVPKGSLFPRRRNDQGQEIGQRGWAKYVPQSEEGGRP